MTCGNFDNDGKAPASPASDNTHRIYQRCNHDVWKLWQWRERPSITSVWQHTPHQSEM